MMIEGFPQSKKYAIRFFAAMGALVITSGLFLIIPLTQTLSDTEREIVAYRSMQMALSPPPALPPPPEDIHEVASDVKATMPEMERPIEHVPIQQLELSLAPGMGVALTMGVPTLPVVGDMDVVADIEKIFNFDELVKVPTLLNAHMIQADFPRELARRGVKEARIDLEILIDKTGKVTVSRILFASYDHPKLREAAKKAASQARFSITKVNDRPVTVRGRFPLTLQAPR